MTEAEVAKYWSFLLATAGPIATLGAIYATFSRLRKDVADHQERDTFEFDRIHAAIADIRERTARIEGHLE